jgi:DNA-binding transcriptional regulator YhcF (GntR family)
MGSANIYTLFAIDKYSITPKYLQLTNSIFKGIDAGKIDKDDLLPSINDLSYEPEISRDTGERAYKHLKKMGIIGSIPGKGCFIARTDINKKIKNFLLF